MTETHAWQPVGDLAGAAVLDVLGRRRAHLDRGLSPAEERQIDVAEAWAHQSAQTGAEAKARRVAAKVLALAIARADPADARALMSAALVDLSPGLPDGPDIFTGRARADARYWATVATEVELAEYAAAILSEINGRALALKARKQVLAALFQSLPAAERKAFLARVDPLGKFQARAR